ncbi:hypothetical protein TAMA11512_11230 [Selenomonas sp. TAMA-11512]|uniref:hypothetical protein n=1 Tax=Selenomonas sp. TAMA-11512 TaxID=3095337 RepID=UPI003092288F|nr:hypothetical protein TAMA11512_11230 [Selenomonas sp. TAMA-11512]
MTRVSRAGKIRLYAVLVLVAAAVVGCGIWYFSYYTKSPDYAVERIQEAIEQKNQEMFLRYVDLDAVLDSSIDALLLGVVEFDDQMPAEARAAMMSYLRMFKMPLVTTLKQEILHYVANGEWMQADAEEQSENPLDMNAVLTRTGLSGLQFRQIDYITQDKEAGTAAAGVRVFQTDAAEEFVFDVELVQNEGKGWQVKSIRNFQDFIMLVERTNKKLLVSYLEQTKSIMERHDAAVRNIDLEIREALQKGALGNTATRETLKALMVNKLIPEWESRKAELQVIAPPQAANTLHNLRIKIADLHIAYAQGYAAWMEDKKASTIREAEAKLKQARTLEEEASILARHIAGTREHTPVPDMPSADISEATSARSK